MALREREAEEYVEGVCFKTGPPGRVGVELEWLVYDSADHRAAPAAARVRKVLESLPELPARSRLTREPGGQVELSTLPASDLLSAVAATAADLAVLRAAFDDAGLRLTGYGLDPWRTGVPRVLDHPRYRAMEAYLDRIGPWGRMMMRDTASVQINLDAGDTGDGPAGYRARWRLVHRLGPVLIAAFANSPLRAGRPTGLRSTRQEVWARLDPCRTRPAPARGRPPDGDPRSAWAGYALDARLLCLRRGEPGQDGAQDGGGAGDGGAGGDVGVRRDGRSGAPAPGPADWDPPPGLTFRGWVREGHAAAGRGPLLEDLDYHLTTLFPPIRPRGWLELRMIDAQRGEDWAVAAALAAVLLDDPRAAEAAHTATEPLCPPGRETPEPAAWARAARLGPSDPELGKAVRACFAAADDALGRIPGAAELRRRAADFAARYAERGRCPADDLLDAARTGAMPGATSFPFPEGHRP